MLFISFSHNSFSWGSKANRVIGGIAIHYLSPAVKERIEAIAGSTSENTLPFIANETSFMKNSEDTFAWQRCKGDIKTGNLVGLKCRRVDISWSETSKFHMAYNDIFNLYEDFINEKTGNVVSMTRDAVLILKNKHSNAEERYNALMWLVSSIADIHQPLNSGNSSDNNGKRIHVSWFGGNYTMHDIWENVLIDSEGLSYSEYASYIINIFDGGEYVEKIKNSCVFSWFDESVKIMNNIYREYDNLKENIDENLYLYNNLPIVRKRIFDAGVRLASTLNYIFEPNDSHGFCFVE